MEFHPQTQKLESTDSGSERVRKLNSLMRVECFATSRTHLVVFSFLSFWFYVLKDKCRGTASVENQVLNLTQNVLRERLCNHWKQSL